MMFRWIAARQWSRRWRDDSRRQRFRSRNRRTGQRRSSFVGREADRFRLFVTLRCRFRWNGSIAALLSLFVTRHELGETAVVLLDVGIAAIESQRFAILLERAIEIAVRFHRHGQIVVSHGIARIEIDGALEAELRLAPEIHPRHLHAEVLLRGWPLEIGRVVRTTEEWNEKQ